MSLNGKVIIIQVSKRNTFDLNRKYVLTKLRNFSKMNGCQESTIANDFIGFHWSVLPSIVKLKTGGAFSVADGRGRWQQMVAVLLMVCEALCTRATQN